MGCFLYFQCTHCLTGPAEPDFLERIRSDRLSLGDKSLVSYRNQCHQWIVRWVWQRESHGHRTGLYVNREQRPWHRQYESTEHELPWQLHTKLREECCYLRYTCLHSRQRLQLQGLVWRMHGYSIDLHCVHDRLSLGDGDLCAFKGWKALAVSFESVSAPGPTTLSTESSSAASKKPRTRTTIHLHRARPHATA